MKPLPDYHYRESKENWENRTLGKDPREAEDRADEEWHRKREEE